MSSTTNRDKLYVWEHGDTFALVAIKYRRTQREYIEVLDLNKALVRRNNWIMRPGDVIEIPDSWFPLREPDFNVVVVGTWGRRDTNANQTQ